jgi:hypothetical protein
LPAQGRRKKNFAYNFKISFDFIAGKARYGFKRGRAISMSVAHQLLPRQKRLIFHLGEVTGSAKNASFPKYINIKAIKG